MMDNELRPYKEYKLTDLPWIDMIPAHWSIQRNKNVMSQSKTLVGKNHNAYKLLSLTLNGIIARDLTNPKGKFPKEFDTYQVVNKNDLVFCLFDIDETPRAIGLSPMDGMITGAYTVFNVSKANERFLYYYYLAIDNSKLLKPLYTGLRKVISADTFLRTKLPLPPRSEQDQIVKYLDHKLAKINKFIKAKKKLITVLKEQKQAIINQAVTKGLDPNVKMKPSGIGWLGDVPEHWEICKLKKYARINPTISNIRNKYSLDDKVVFLPMESISTDGGICNSDHRKITDVKTGFTSFKRSDVIIAKITPCFENGKGAYLGSLETEIGYGTTELIVLRTVEELLLAKYLYYITRSGYFRILGSEVMTGSAGQKRIPTSFVSNFTIGIPNVDEQRYIIEFIDSSHKKINISILVVEQELELLLEYKNSLISDVVTGKVDVRHIPIDEIEELDLGEPEPKEELIEEEMLDPEEGDE